MNNHEFLRIQTGLGLQDFKAVEPFLFELNRSLTLRSFVHGHAFSEKDTLLWTAICLNKVALGLIRRSIFINVTRWYTYLESTYPEVQQSAKVRKNGAKAGNADHVQTSRYGIELQNTHHGVVTRFPPEPSGYLHVGHAKAAFLNDYFAHDEYNGSMILRFDDTNPIRETQEYEDSILEDVKVLGIRNQRVTYTSDYFEQLYQLCEKLIADGNAYAEDADPKVQAELRRERKPSARRDRSPSESLAIFKEMREGTDFGRKHCIRARIEFHNSNGALRDPVIYRFPQWTPGQEPQPHHRTGSTWNIYPTYDFACPLVDSIEGVTHALRTTEYSDRNDQYYWFLKALNMRHVYLWDFARLNFIRTFLSKRKLARVVDTGRVSGWDDPRMPTVRGIVRRGLRMDVLREFMLKQGPSRNVVTMDWTVIWAMNKKATDPMAARHTAIDIKDKVVAEVLGGPDTSYTDTKPKHPTNVSMGTKTVVFANRIYIDQADAALLTKDEEITLMSWGNAVVRKIGSEDGRVTELTLELHLAGNVSKTDKKVHWLAADPDYLIKAELWYFDYLLTKDTLKKGDDLDEFLNRKTSATANAVVDANAAALATGDVIQLERKGYFRVDQAISENAEGKLVLFNIPTGAKNNQ